MPAVIDEGALTPELAAPVSVPVGADTRTAASLLPAWTGIIKRLMFLESWYDLAKVITLGGTLEPVANLVLDLSLGRLDIIGNDDNNINLGGLNGSPGGVQFYANGNMASHMFTAGRTGRANRKLVNLGTSANQTIDPRTEDTFCYLTGANINVQVSTAEVDLKDGEWFRVVNKITSSGTITVKNTAGTTLHVVPLPSTLPAMREYVWHAATSSWVLTDWAVA